MKLNWGYKILLIYLAFVIMIGILVYRSMHESFDLVSDDYYDKEVKYQQQINNMQNTLALNEKPVTDYNRDKETVEIKFPGTLSPRMVSGEVSFFRPDNSMLDFKVNINLNHENIQVVDSRNLKHGSWKIKTSWKSNNISYYQEENIFIN